MDFLESPVFNQKKEVNFKGGYDGQYSSATGMTQIRGKMLIRQGTVRVRRLQSIKIITDANRYALNLFSVPALSLMMFSWCLKMTTAAMASAITKSSCLPSISQTMTGISAAATIEASET